MLRIGPVSRRTVFSVSSLATVGASSGGVYYYANSDQGLGMRREYLFWKRMFPIVFDYLWKTSSKSPYVKYQNFMEDNYYRNETATAASTSAGTNKEESIRNRIKKEKRNKLLQELHSKHAPEILDVMLQLKGLYVKLGQVLSVSALPLPEAYRKEFRTLQSDVTGWEPFDDVVKPVIEKEFGKPIEEIFQYFDPIPCGAASIGQAHRAILRTTSTSDDDDNDDIHNNSQTKRRGKEEVIVKVQYPNAKWEVPADIQCVGDFLKICVYFNVVDEIAAKLSYDEFSRQFISELDYEKEKENLKEVYNSSLDPLAPYRKRNVIIPKVYNECCTKSIITMSYLPGPKLEAEAKRQLELLGIDTKSKGIREIVNNTVAIEKETVFDEIVSAATDDTTTATIDTVVEQEQSILPSEGTNDNMEKKIVTTVPDSWKVRGSRVLSHFVSVDAILWTLRFAQRLALWSTSFAITGLNIVSSVGIVLPSNLLKWIESHRTARQQVERLSLTAEWLDALFDVHGHQIFNLGLFNADPHPGNILVIEHNDDQDEDEYFEHMVNSDDKNKKTAINNRNHSSKTSYNTKRSCSNDSKRHASNMLGLIDYGQCKRLNLEEQVKVAKLIVCVANNENDDIVANEFRNLGIKTKNDSTEYLAKFARLMFGPLLPEHLDPKWHKTLHETDKLLYFPKELSMVYRTCMLLRGLAISLQFNYSACEKWKDHAQDAINRANANETVFSQITK